MIIPSRREYSDEFIYTVDSRLAHDIRQPNISHRMTAALYEKSTNTIYTLQACMLLNAAELEKTHNPNRMVYDQQEDVFIFMKLYLAILRLI